LVGFTGHEAVSQLFNFQLDLLAENATEVPFDQLLGQPVAVGLRLADGQLRPFHGICSRVSQGARDDNFTAYRMEVVPALWLLTRRFQSRIFQHLSVPDILRQVLAGLDVSFQIAGTFFPRDYCVQYRETDFAFASRLMEEEGIYYFFQHAEGRHTLVLANTPEGHPDLPEPSRLTFDPTEDDARDEDCISEWEKVQELRSGKCILWDHCFELPHKHLEATKTILDGVAVGQVTHKLQVGGNDRLEVYDYPGQYAQRFDGVDKGGSVRPAELQKIFQDNERTTKLRMEAEAAAALAVAGASHCRHLASGHRFTLERHFDADGPYVLTRVEHNARLVNYRSDQGGDFVYNNQFACIPAALPFRPPRVTPKPVVQGSQTAVVVGPPGEEIFCDKYGRVKVQFHWDRQGQRDANSSCWIRVATIWAGKKWGIVNVPRIGHEVVVDFLEGDPDQPIIVGSVHNADHMPPDELPKTAMVSGLKSNSTPGGGGYNGLTFDDTKGKEQVTLHGQYDMATTIEHDDTQTVHNDRTITVDGKHTETITGDTTIKITEGKLAHDVVANTADYHVKGAVTENFDATQATTVKDNITIKSLEGEILIKAAKKITLHTGDSKITLHANGKISIEGVTIIVTGRTDIKESAPTVEICGTQQTVMGVSSQTVTCDTTKVATSGAGISATAVGVHEISGAMVKIN
jgi:type VI secretion system secreted protein VgrG